MRKAATCVIGLMLAGTAFVHAQSPAPQPVPVQPATVQPTARGGGQQPMPPGPNPNSQYRLGPDSLPQEGVPKGEIRGPFTLPSNAYPGTQHTYWVYVPAQYDPAVAAALMVYQDGQAFKNDGVVAGLPQQAQYFGVTVLAVDKNLFLLVVAGFDAILQLEYPRTTRVNQRKIVMQS